MWQKIGFSKAQSGCNNRLYVLIAALAVAAFLIGVAWVFKGSTSAAAMPQSPEARIVVEQQLKSACGSAGGTLSGGRAGQKAFYEGDLTGNGEMDFILSHSGVRCANDQINLRCGMEGCSLLVFAQQGADLELAAELDALDFEVEHIGHVPVITYRKADDQYRQLFWNGHEFQNMSRWEMPEGFLPQYLPESIR